MTDPGTTTSAPAARLSEARITEVLATRYGMEDVTLKTLGGEVDQNLKVTTSDGRNYVFKVSPPGGDAATPRWQNAVLAHLAGSTLPIDVPRLVPGLAGEEIIDIEADGVVHVARLLSWVEGRTLREIEHHPDELLTELGQVAGLLGAVLSNMPEPVVQVGHDWDMREARNVVAEGIGAMDDPDRSADVDHVMAWFDEVTGRLDRLPRQVAHQDLNDANVLVRRAADGTLRVSGVVDVGDALYTVRVAEIAVCAGYAMIRKADPLHAAATVIAGFDAALPLTDDELAMVFPLAAARLCMNAVTWNKRVRELGSAYGQDRMRHTWPAIRRVSRIVPEVAEEVIRQACGRAPRQVPEIAPAGSFAGSSRVAEVDLSPGGEVFDELDWTDPARVRAALAELLGDRTATVGVVAPLRPDLTRSARRRPGVDEPATIRLGTGLLLAPGATVRLPLPGVVERAPDGDAPLVLRHDDGDRSFWTCWWGFDLAASEGTEVTAGGPLGTVSTAPAADGLDGLVQVVAVTTERLAHRDLPRHVRPAEAAAWAAVTADARTLLGLPVPPAGSRRNVDDILALRGRHIATSQRAYYRRPMNLVRGRGVWFYDEDGMAYLDSLNNVTHVGHCEPRVTQAAMRQMRRLNTNSRFVYEGIATYAERLTATLPDPLEVVFLVCSGSEANDLAMRIARQVTGRQDLVVIDGAYHGNTGVVTGISPNRYKGAGGAGAPDTTHEIPTPDRYRGPYGYDDPDAGHKYAADAKRVFDDLVARGRPPAAFIAESLMGTAGNIVLPDGFLSGAFDAARAAGAICVSDEVQVGVGRMGDHFWGFQLSGVVPDIVTMGKPLGNGHPLAAVVTTREIADAFDTGMKYFNTFGGNPVSCAIGTSVLDIVQQDGLQEHARQTGGYYLSALRELGSRHPIIGDVRGQGLYLGVELVRDPATREPAKDEAFLVTELMKERGVITFPNGVHDNVLKIKPPMSFDRGHVDLYVEALDDVLSSPRLR